MAKPKIQMTISNKGLRELKELQTEVEAVSRSDVIRSSIKVLKYLEGQKKLGNEIIIRDIKSKKEKELIF
jgi:hypothetical protein